MCCGPPFNFRRGDEGAETGTGDGEKSTNDSATVVSSPEVMSWLDLWDLTTEAGTKSGVLQGPLRPIPRILMALKISRSL
uniref:Uncharacterized protein n=1 Tax=Rodentolepis nana TaxID=102285 RepID=A0A0R3TG90_RODNA